jgi:hypothetical protein
MIFPGLARVEGATLWIEKGPPLLTALGAAPPTDALTLFLGTVVLKE